jgi:hypothetical protein
MPSLIARLAVVASFALKDIVRDADDPEDVTATLDSSAEPIFTRTGGMRWSITEMARRDALGRLALAELRHARASVYISENTVLQQILDRSLGDGWTAGEVATLTPEEARALIAVAGWWQGRLEPAVPDPVLVTGVLERINLFADIRQMASDHFVGREDVLGDLRTSFLVGGSLPLMIFGPGGIGKSAVIARHTAWALDEQGAYVALMDFDDLSLNPAYPDDILARIVRVIGQQTNDRFLRARLERLSVVARDYADRGSFAFETSSRGYEGSPALGALDYTVNELQSMLDRELLVIFDTIEQVPRRGVSAGWAFATLVQALSSSVRGRVRVVLAGRAALPGLNARPYELSGLNEGDALRLLTDLAGKPVPPAVAKSILATFGTSPLTIRLIARLLATTDALDDLLALRLRAETVDGVLYRRVLEHVRDQDVRRLAHPGLVLRRVSPEIIQKVLARSCGVYVPDESTARMLFEVLSREVMLVEYSHTPGTLVHRADVRRAMLPQLLADQPDVAARIQRAAIAFYKSKDDPESKSEELYHRLMLDQAPSTLRRHWDDRAARSLATVRDEFPVRARIYLAGRLPETYLNDTDRTLVDDARWMEEIRSPAEHLIEAHEPDAALRLLHERRGPDGGSLLPDVEINALEAAGDIRQAVELARAARKAASAAGDLDDVAAHTLSLARLLETRGDLRAAAAALDDAVSMLPRSGIPRLRLLLARLGLERRQWAAAPDASGFDVEASRAEAHKILDSLSRRDIRSTPGLLRDAVAELGDEILLEDALTNVGVDALPSGAITNALRDLDEVSAEDAGRGRVTALLKGSAVVDDGPVWSTIPEMPRGETGRTLIEVINSLGKDADMLRSAIVEDYQRESDDALFRVKRGVIGKK